jgi:hypothetical protein
MKRLLVTMLQLFAQSLCYGAGKIASTKVRMVIYALTTWTNILGIRVRRIIRLLDSF